MAHGLKRVSTPKNDFDCFEGAVFDDVVVSVLKNSRALHYVVTLHHDDQIFVQGESSNFTIALMTAAHNLRQRGLSIVSTAGFFEQLVQNFQTNR